MNKTVRRRTLIEIETHEITVFRTNEKRTTVFCGNCDAEVVAAVNEQLASFGANSLEPNLRATAAENCIQIAGELY
jgi:hypothetical protein